MKEKLVCQTCGNSDKFYRCVSVDAKMVVTKTGNDTKRIYGARNRYETVDNEYEAVYCSICDHVVLLPYE